MLGLEDDSFFFEMVPFFSGVYGIHSVIFWGGGGKYHPSLL